MNNFIKTLLVAAPFALSMNVNAATYAVGTASAGTYTSAFDFSSSFNDGTELLDYIEFALTAQSTVTATSSILGTVASFESMPGFNFINPLGTTPLSKVLDAGSYKISFKNALNSTGSWTGGITVAAVPEPETYALMLAGLGLIGFSARRRQA